MMAAFRARGRWNVPLLRHLLEDIRRRFVDVVVVYKVDRLTRSLADFAKMVEVFDARYAFRLLHSHAAAIQQDDHFDGPTHAECPCFRLRNSSAR